MAGFQAKPIVPAAETTASWRTNFTGNAGIVRCQFQSLDRWLHRPGQATRLFLGKASLLVAWAGLIVTAFSPPLGLGISLCWFEGATGVPCPGCGLMRSLSCGLRGLWGQSWHFHPFGLLVLGVFIFTAGQSLLPRVRREAVARFVEHHSVAFSALYVLFVIAFLGFGALRALFHLFL